MSPVCFWVRRRLSPYVDGGLSGRPARAIANHLRRCPGCREAASRLERMRALVQETFSGGPEPDWSGFWEGVRRRIALEPEPRATRWGLWWPSRVRPRLALGGAVAGLLLLLGGVLWQSAIQEESVPSGVVVSAVETSDPNKSVMIFSSPEDEMTVIWILGPEQPPDESWLRPRGLTPRKV